MSASNYHVYTKICDSVTISVANPGASDTILKMDDANPSYLWQSIDSASLNSNQQIDLNKIAAVTSSYLACPITKYEIIEPSGVTTAGTSVSGCGSGCTSPKLSFTADGGSSKATFKLKITAYGGVTKTTETINIPKKGCGIKATMLKSSYTTVHNFDIKNDVEKTSIDLPF